ncbi:MULTISPECIES: hypothetical protein [Bradyrhizobium]|uniref:hypothetical protein n=1 Tax=Bradyrhizobium elkanii TaxID=29448 RepID=UPI002714E339|nr:hypothetical protein [Bradyrhizobium elkanii]WLA46255.1 hypothetical protein QIH80_31300 [Bradyrhizobium elkanii]WLB83468.1 hypothetical protein QIH83_13415 [Bradyrhizobium elkanii]
MAIVDLPEPPLLFPTTTTRALVMGIHTGRLSESRTKQNLMNGSNLPDSTNLDKSRRTIGVIEIDAAATTLSQPQSGHVS